MTDIHANTDAARASRSAGDIAHDLLGHDLLSENYRFTSRETGARSIKDSRAFIKENGDISFRFKRIKLNGLKTVSAQDFKHHWVPYVGKRIRLSVIGRIVKKIESDLRRRGLLLARVVIPPQDIHPKKGTIQVDIYEGTLGHVRVEGGTKEIRGQIYNQLTDIARGKSLNLSDIEERLRFVKKTPGYVIRHVLAPSKKIKDATDLVMIVERKIYVKAGLMFDNSGNRLSGKQRMGADGVVFNTFGRSKTLFGTIHDVRMSNFHFYRLRQTQFLGDNGTRGYLEYVQSRSDPKVSFDMKSRFDYVNLMIMHPLIYRQDQELKIRFALDGQNDAARIGGLRTKDDYIRAVRFGILYNRTYARDFWELSVMGHRGITGVLGGGNTIRPSKVNGKASFHYLDGRGIWAHQITDRLSFAQMFSWQYSGTPLLATEEMSIGSSNFGRGYDSAEITGDHGIGGVFELRYMLPKFSKYIDFIQLFGSYGLGYVKNSRLKIDSERSASVASVAAGVRGQLFDHLSFSYEAAKPLTRTVALRKNRKLHHSVKVTYKVKFDKKYKLLKK